MNVSYLYTFSVSRCWMSYYKTHRYSLGQPLSLQPLSATMQHKITAWVKPLSLHVNKITAWVKPLSLHVNKITAWVKPLSLHVNKITALVKPLSLHVNRITVWVQPLSLHANYELEWITAIAGGVCVMGFLSINCLLWHQNFQQSNWLNTVCAIHAHVLLMQE